MRPLALMVKGFTAFRDEQKIDFTDLDLFVLTGPTGSGKSSLLDAMTYALFGVVERVGNQAAQLISQGQPRMAVTLDFRVGAGTYRVARSTPAKGHSKVLLERLEGSDWISYGEGADSIREVNRIVTGLIGLDYEAFTRSVILPQGKFAEFLTGDAKQRREILTELLGLELFGRMAQRAGEISRNAKVGFETKQGVLDREYAGVDDEALRKAKADLVKTKKALKQAESNEARLAEIEKRWTAANTRVGALSKCAREAAGLAQQSGSASMELDALVSDLKQARAAVTSADKAEADAKKFASAAGATRTKAEKRLGDLASLNQLLAKAEQVADLSAETEDAARSVVASQKTLAGATEEVGAADERLEAERAAHASALEDLARAEADHEAAHRSDLVGTLTHDLTSGDPCPVCSRPLDELPATDRKALSKAKAALKSAAEAKDRAATRVANGEKASALATQSLKTARESLARCEKELARKKDRAEDVEAQLQTALGRKIDDPMSEIADRISQLDELAEAEEKALDAFAEAQEEAGRKRLALERKERQVSEILVRLRALTVEGLIERISDADAQVELPAALPHELPEDPGAVAAVAAGFAKDLEKLAEDLDAAGVACRREMEVLVTSARKLLPEAAVRGLDDLQAMIAVAKGDAKQLGAETAKVEAFVKSLTERLEQRRRLEKEVETDRATSDLYGALGKELKSDRIVSFLQAEALAALAAVAGVHLRDLSRTRYDLEYEDDRFYVVDSWNGNERRNVKTLSGGETFLASLALALALSEQVQNLAVTERERLESLFLDEGFGTLDPEALEAVVEGIEELGRDGRLVGVITHVPELAARLPVRLNVTKSPRGSTVTRDDG